jgi:hypothetical protein
LAGERRPRSDFELTTHNYPKEIEAMSSDEIAPLVGYLASPEAV